MSQNFQTNYQPLGGSDVHGQHGTEQRSVDITLDREREDDLSPDTHSSMVFHVVPKSSKSRWNHIEDLDTFFKRVYHYHQSHGIICMMLQHFLELMQFMFIVVFTTFLVKCIDYDILFRNKVPPHFSGNYTAKITINDVLRNSDDIFGSFGFWTISLLLVASMVWLVRLGYVCFIFLQFWEIKMFFNNALGFLDSDISNITWEEVQQRLMEVQVEQRMCIHKEVLTELDIYHRILRFNNYFIAMVNKNIIPLKYKVPFVSGDIVVLTRSLQFNIDMLLFWGPLSPFKNNWHLNDEYKRSENRQKLAEELSKRILIVGIGNLMLFPLIFIFQFLYNFFNYGELIKREPGTLGTRRWSNYGEVYLRHFNELQHELSARLCRGYKAASQYMNIFSSPALAISARHVSFVMGAIMVVLAGLTVFDEDVLLVEHLITIGSIAGVVFGACAACIPDENLVFAPEMLVRRVLGEVHYIPDHWREKGHTTMVRHEFSQLFQYKLVFVIEELLSPIITPLVLICRLRYKSLEIVDFFRNFTVEVVGVGDVCSFAQMDIRQHGSPTWQPDTLLDLEPQPQYNSNKPDKKTDGGKTELSLLHFTVTNPRWKPPLESSAFITALRTQAQRDMNALGTVHEENALLSSLNSISFGGGLGAATTSMFYPWMKGHGGQAASMQFQQSGWFSKSLRGNISHVEGSRHGPSGGLLSSITQHQMGQSSVGSPIGTSNDTSGPVVDPVLAPSTVLPSSMWNTNMVPTLPQDLTAVDMSLSTMYLHEIHHRNRHRVTYTDNPVNASRPSIVPTGGAFQNVSFTGQPSGPTPDGSDTPSVLFQRAQEKMPLLPDP